MSSEWLRPGQIESRRRRALAAYVRREVHPYSALNRRRLDAAGLGSRVAGPDDLARLPPMSLREVDDPTAMVLRPTRDSILASGDPLLRWRVTWGQAAGRRTWLNDHVIGPVFKPVHWTDAGGVLIAWSSDDLDRLADLGRRWLTMSGLRRSDSIVSLLPPAPTLAFWELALGSRCAGLSAVHLGPAGRDVLGELAPTVVAGPVDELAAVDTFPRGVRILLVVDGVPADDVRGDLAERAGGATVLGAWAPDPARALWAECRPGGGVHTWPETEVVQAAPDGELVWSPIGWRGSVLLRAATGVAAAVDPSPCRACGRTTPRVKAGA
jgi:hypothetical protein